MQAGDVGCCRHVSQLPLHLQHPKRCYLVNLLGPPAAPLHCFPQAELGVDAADESKAYITFLVPKEREAALPPLLQRLDAQKLEVRRACLPAWRCWKSSCSNGCGYGCSCPAACVRLCHHSQACPKAGSG